MQEDPYPVRKTRGDQTQLDAIDRKLLSLLARNAELSYNELSQQVHLSAPAVHERVKRLKSRGAIRATVALLDGLKVGRALLAFVHLETSNWETTRRVLEMSAFPEIEEIHTVAGDTAMILKVRTENSAALENMLGKLHRLEGFKGVKTFIALGTYLERGPLPV
ncbi:Lrp/AsnC family transcriptional regulator [Pseudomonas mucidolens]|uniref:Transcriptional regulator, AsnC family n=1 Tax=Pseudomonas mucidolens TaxID=46679 RepID=A0A1H2NE94_9PSED|nr:Lrp/AsnC family transcriptional regulator [Pseudomonas mucidolens]SDV03684.1 transcriptional regulator, AsnC family [Pseudomonas mucidolens]SQH32129.1 AsnC family transcriptional regulator [Pseudomonas mucidolens]